MPSAAARERVIGAMTIRLGTVRAPSVSGENRSLVDIAILSCGVRVVRRAGALHDDVGSPGRAISATLAHDRSAKRAIDRRDRLVARGTTCAAGRRWRGRQRG